MLTVLLVIAVFALSIRLAGTSLAAKAIVRYIVKKGYEPPNTKELKACIQEELKSKFPWYSGKA